MATAGSRFSVRKQSRWRVLLPPLLVVIGVAAVLYYYDGPVEADVPRDGDLCPVDDRAIAGSVSLLVDFRKPLEADRVSLLGELVEEITRQLEKDHELQIFTLTASSAAPRAPVGRLCKPYRNADLQVKEAKDQRGTARDCDDLPAQLADHVRNSAGRFCARRTVLQQRLGGLYRRPWRSDRPVESAYLVEAIEDMRLEMAEHTGGRALYLFSDMMQHAGWWSHLDLGWTDWKFSTFSELLDEQGWAIDGRRASEDMSVEVFYVPRENLTDQPRAQAMHQQFWEHYFSGSRVVFHNQPPMVGYEFVPLMNVPSDAEIAAAERAAAEQLMLQVEQERDRLQRQQEELEAEQERQAREQRERELQAQRLVEERQRRELEEARKQQELARQRLEEERQLAERKVEAPPQPESAPATASESTGSPELHEPAPDSAPAVAAQPVPAELPPCDFDGPIGGVARGTRVSERREMGMLAMRS